jgi:hypothetical protein
VPECKAMYKDLIALKNIMMLVTVWQLAQDP